MTSAVKTNIPRVALWCTPRSLSTAFERAVLELGNIEVFHEEYTTAYFFGPERSRDQFTVGLAPNHTYKWVKNTLQADYPGRDAVFLKEHSYPLFNRHEMIPEGFYHTFLIRDPTMVFSSLIPRLQLLAPISNQGIRDMVNIERNLYKTLRDVHDEIKSRGLPTLIMDADDLLEDPVQMFRQYCQITGLPFKESMVTWKPANFKDMNWHCSRALRFLNYSMGWYEGALKSSGFHKSKPRHVDMDSLYPDTKLAIELSQPYYDELYMQRMRLKYSEN